MRRLTHKVSAESTANASITLPLDLRIKSRLRVTLDTGEDAGLFLEKGSILRGGEQLATEDGFVVRVNAAQEQVSSVYTDDPLQLAKACYHLGNRHIPLQIDTGMLRYQHDHVLDEMVRGFGLTVTVEMDAFEPEGGAYQTGGHGHSHGHSHDNDHEHNHEASHDQRHSHDASHSHSHEAGHSHSHAHDAPATAEHSH